MREHAPEAPLNQLAPYPQAPSGRDERSERALYHEAGHAIAALAVGVRVKLATVTGEDPRIVTLRRRRDLPLLEADVERMVAVEMAGYFAERRLNWRQRAWARHCAKTDFANADAWVARGSGAVASRRCLRAAWRIVRKYWPAIEEVADRLRDRGALVEKELFEIVARHGIDPRAIDGFEEAMEVQ